MTPLEGLIYDVIDLRQDSPKPIHDNHANVTAQEVNVTLSVVNKPVDEDGNHISDVLSEHADALDNVEDDEVFALDSDIMELEAFVVEDGSQTDLLPVSEYSNEFSQTSPALLRDMMFWEALDEENSQEVPQVQWDVKEATHELAVQAVPVMADSSMQCGRETAERSTSMETTFCDSGTQTEITKMFSTDVQTSSECIAVESNVVRTDDIKAEVTSTSVQCDEEKPEYRSIAVQYGVSMFTVPNEDYIKLEAEHHVHFSVESGTSMDQIVCVMCETQTDNKTSESVQVQCNPSVNSSQTQASPPSSTDEDVQTEVSVESKESQMEVAHAIHSIIDAVAEAESGNKNALQAAPFWSDFDPTPSYDELLDAWRRASLITLSDIWTQSTLNVNSQGAQTSRADTILEVADKLTETKDAAVQAAAEVCESSTKVSVSCQTSSSAMSNTETQYVTDSNSQEVQTIQTTMDEVAAEVPTVSRQMSPANMSDNATQYVLDVSSQEVQTSDVEPAREVNDKYCEATAKMEDSGVQATDEFYEISKVAVALQTPSLVTSDTSTQYVTNSSLEEGQALDVVPATEVSDKYCEASTETKNSAIQATESYESSTKVAVALQTMPLITIDTQTQLVNSSSQEIQTSDMQLAREVSDKYCEALVKMEGIGVQASGEIHENIAKAVVACQTRPLSVSDTATQYVVESISQEVQTMDLKTVRVTDKCCEASAAVAENAVQASAQSREIAIGQTDSDSWIKIYIEELDQARRLRCSDVGVQTGVLARVQHLYTKEIEADVEASLVQEAIHGSAEEAAASAVKRKLSGGVRSIAAPPITISHPEVSTLDRLRTVFEGGSPSSSSPQFQPGTSNFSTPPPPQIHSPDRSRNVSGLKTLFEKPKSDENLQTPPTDARRNSMI